jgi:hypothetical protein
MGIPIISDILTGIQNLISHALSLLQSLIQSAPPTFKLIFFMFLMIFVGGFIIDFSIGTYYTCQSDVLYKPNNVINILPIKYAKYQSGNLTNYCAGDIQLHHCSNYSTEQSCDCFCPDKWNSNTSTCTTNWILFDWVNLEMFSWLNFGLIEGVTGSNCNIYSQTCCGYADGCYWVSSLEQTPYFQTLTSLSTIVPADKEGFYIGCTSDEKDEVSLFFGGLDIFGYELVLSVFLLSIVFSVISFMGKF